MFEEFQKYVYENINSAPAYPANWLLPVEEADIIKAEERIGFSFPSELRQFYQEIGFGGINTSKDGKVPEPQSNMIIDPDRLADIYLGEDDWVPDDIGGEGELPFFNVADQLYFVMKPKTNTPNAVFWSSQKQPITESFVEFMQLLYEDPRFYTKKPYFPYDLNAST